MHIVLRVAHDPALQETMGEEDVGIGGRSSCLQSVSRNSAPWVHPQDG
jgi:hypothetical protein